MELRSLSRVCWPQSSLLGSTTPAPNPGLPWGPADDRRSILLDLLLAMALPPGTQYTGEGVTPLPAWPTLHSHFCGPDFIWAAGQVGGWCGRLVLPKLVSWFFLCSLVLATALRTFPFWDPSLRVSHFDFGFLSLSCLQSRQPDSAYRPPCHLR